MPRNRLAIWLFALLAACSGGSTRTTATSEPAADIAVRPAASATVTATLTATAAEELDEEAEALAFAEAPPIPPEDLRKTMPVADSPKERRRLRTILRKKELRVLVFGQEEGYLPRPGLPAMDDIATAEAFAEHLGVEPVFVLVERHDDLIPKLIEGRGDVIASQLTVTRERRRKVAFVRSTLGTAEIVVGQKGTENLPKALEDLDGRKVYVRASSAYASTLRDLGRRRGGPKVEIVPVEEYETTEDIVMSVIQGRRALTIADSHLLDAIATYADGFERLFPLSERRQIAWAVRRQSTLLRDRLNRFLQARALTVHTNNTATPDLAGIKKRRVLRVLTRNNALTYLLYRGQQLGFDYHLVKKLAEDIGVRLEVLVVPSRDKLIPWLLDGRGDLVAASMTITDDRREQVAFSRPYLFTDEVVVGRRARGVTVPKTVEELSGRTVHVRASSSYAQTLKELQGQGIDVKVEYVPEDMETEQILEGVGAKKYELTVADKHIVAVEVSYGTRIREGVALTQAPADKDDDAAFAPDGGKSIAFAMRPSSLELKTFVDDWVKKNYRGARYNMYRKRYLSAGRRVRRYKRRRLGRTGQISPYDAIIKKYARRYGFDWRLMAAQSFVESRFDPSARSWVGAQGLFQVMPNTGASMGFYKLSDPDVGTHAGIKYMDKLVRRFDPKLPFRQRVRFALAAYNAGLGHVIDARRLAEEKGWNPDKWFGHVEKAMLLLAQPKYYRKARYGYCRGAEPVAYVSHIQAKYQAYQEVTD